MPRIQYEGVMIIGTGGLWASTFESNLYWSDGSNGAHGAAGAPQPDDSIISTRGFPCNASNPPGQVRYALHSINNTALVAMCASADDDGGGVAHRRTGGGVVWRLGSNEAKTRRAELQIRSSSTQPGETFVCRLAAQPVRWASPRSTMTSDHADSSKSLTNHLYYHGLYVSIVAYHYRNWHNAYISNMLKPVPEPVDRELATVTSVAARPGRHVELSVVIGSIVHKRYSIWLGKPLDHPPVQVQLALGHFDRVRTSTQRRFVPQHLPAVSMRLQQCPGCAGVTIPSTRNSTWVL